MGNDQNSMKNACFDRHETRMMLKAEIMAEEESRRVAIVALDMDRHTFENKLDRNTLPDEEDNKVDRNRVFVRDSSMRHEHFVSTTEVSMNDHETSKN